MRFDAHAVILGKPEQLKIIFVDAWKTKTQNVYSVTELEKRFPKIHAMFVGYLNTPTHPSKKLNPYDDKVFSPGSEDDEIEPEVVKIHR